MVTIAASLDAVAGRDFDAFLSHSSSDKAAVRDLKLRLEQRQLSIWFDQDQLPPGSFILPVLQRELERAGSVIIAVGDSGMGPYQREETQAALNLAIRLQRTVIPVLLPGSPGPAALDLFLSNRRWLDLRAGTTDGHIDDLVWGITGKKPAEIDSLGPAKNLAEARWILVAGSGNLRGLLPFPARLDATCKLLGEELAVAGFSLVTGGWGGVDELVARAFAEKLQQRGQALAGRLVQVMQDGETPQFPAGRLVSGGTEAEAWKKSIDRADAVVLVGGWGGTITTGESAMNAGKLVLPIADTRGPWPLHPAARKLYYAIQCDWDRKPLSAQMTPVDFERVAGPAPGVVTEIIDLLRETLLRAG